MCSELTSLKYHDGVALSGQQSTKFGIRWGLIGFAEAIDTTLNDPNALFRKDGTICVVLSSIP